MSRHPPEGHVPLPHRLSMVHQLGEILRAGIRSGRWRGWLPEERALARQYQVSRSTLRAAIAHLRKDGLLETRHGLGTRVLRSGAGAGRHARRRSVGILLPRALYRFRHFVTLVVDDLREQLFSCGCGVLVHEHPQVESRQPFELLGRMVEQHRHSGWLLIGCGAKTQRWFGEHRIAAVVSGTCDASLGLPFVSLDNYALGRHAAMTLLQHGHRRIGAILTRSNSPLRSGLNEVFTRDGDAGTSLRALEVDDSVESVARAVDHLMSLSPRPSALFVAESNLYLSTFARLTQLGLRVPETVSLLCRDDEPYLGSLLPSPARYSKNPHVYAKRLLGFLVKVMDAEPPSQPASYLMPEFVPGGSLRRLAIEEVV